MKRTFTALCIAFVVIGTFPLLPTERARAQFGIDFALTQAADAIQEIIKKRFFDMVVDQMVNWIQGGGKPLFIQNWDAFLAQYGNIVTGDILAEMELAGICQPFGIQLQIAVLQPPRFSRQIRCTLDQVVRNMANFYNNFRAGGFIAYREQWQPQNNFYGALLLAMDEKETRIADQRFAALQEVQANSGFLGTRKCDRFGRCYITTPGMQIGAAAAKVIGADLDYIVNSKDMAAYIAAIADAFINRIIREGVSGLQGVVAVNAPPLGYIAPQGANAKPCAGLSGDTLNSCQALEGYKTGNALLVKTSYMAQINDTLTPLLAAQTNLLAIQSAEQLLVNRTSELNNCQIGRGVSERTATIAALAVEQKALEDVTAAIATLQQATIPLTNARATLMNETSTDFGVLSSYLNGPNGVARLLNKAQADAYAITTKAQHDAITEKSTKRLPELQALLQKCISS